ncbi:hypothetical protein [Pedobacter jamesrossensis]|uniref:Uncharacterized protein n=1 Tax=Pedobacter jamesrossensis TaxID=1908238 RepID=A0ABV8NMU2_9SPHI
MEKVLIEKVGWMQQFKITEFENYCQKTGIVANGNLIGYISISGKLFWLPKGTHVFIG